MKYTLPLGVILALTSCVRSPADPLAAPTGPAAPPAPAAAAPHQPAAAPGGLPQPAPAATTPPVAGTPESSDAALAAASQLDIAPDERQYFQFGYFLARSAFAYAELSKRSLAISQVHSKMTQIHQLADLLPSTIRKREEIRAALEKTLATMRDLRAPSSAIAVIENQSREYGKPLVLTGDSKLLADYDPAAGRTLGALDEFERTSGVPENAALHRWLTAPATSTTAKVWYAEGLIAGIAQIASQQQMPELLPPISDVAVDLRGLRDWLSSRLPDQPAAGLTQLRESLDSFLQLTANNRPTKRSLTPSELSMLGSVSVILTTQILGPDAAGAASPVAVAPRSPAAPIATAPTAIAVAVGPNATPTVGPNATAVGPNATPAAPIAPAHPSLPPQGTSPNSALPGAAATQHQTAADE